MNKPILVLYLLNFLLIGALPMLFFRRDGHFNLKWFLTAAPFFVSSFFLLGIILDVVHPELWIRMEWGQVLDMAAIPFAAASIGLLFFTVGTHRIPLALWHQSNDAPKHIVTYGPYRWVRHPFYVSFLLALIGLCINYPHPVTILALLYGYVALNGTARREEKRLCVSEFGDEYAAYMKRTGRFFPIGKGVTV